MQPPALLLLGFLLPTFYIYVRELRSRCAFARVATGQQHRAGRWLRSVPEEEGAWGHDSLAVSWVDYFLFGIPAVACMYLYLVAAG